MAARKAQPNSRPEPIVVYAPLGELKIYEIDDALLNQLESGPEGQLSLNFALALIPVSITILITLQTVSFENDRLFVSYLAAFFLSAIHGLYFLLKWYRSHKKQKDLIQSIRDRVPKRPLEGEPVQIISVQENQDLP
ncbi:MAG: hypothetical protein ACKO0V_03150 [bacterium]